MNWGCRATKDGNVYSCAVEGNRLYDRIEVAIDKTDNSVKRIALKGHYEGSNFTNMYWIENGKVQGRTLAREPNRPEIGSDIRRILTELAVMPAVPKKAKKELETLARAA